MSAQSSSSRAAEIAAEQVEAIVAAAQNAADDIRARAEEEMEERRKDAELEIARIRQDAEKESERILAEAKRDGERDLKEARDEAQRISEDARRQASDRVEAAARAAEEALKQSQAVSEGMRSLGQTLEGQAARMLRDVQAGNRQLLADLRVPLEQGAPAEAPPAELPGEDRERIEAIRSAEKRKRPQSRAESPRAPRRPRPRRESGGPFDDLDVPSWVDEG